MRFYIFIVMACIGLVMGGRLAFESILTGMGHDIAMGTAMFLFSLFSIIAIAYNSKSKSTGKH